MPWVEDGHDKHHVGDGLRGGLWGGVYNRFLRFVRWQRNGQTCLQFMPMSVVRATFVSALVGSLLLVIVLLSRSEQGRDVQSEPAQIFPTSMDDSDSILSPVSQSHRSEDRRPIEVDSVEVIEPIEAPATRHGEGEATRDSLAWLLSDPALLEACASPATIPTEVLKGLLEQAGAAVGTFQTEECERRVNAGLYQALEDYKPGVPFTRTIDSSDSYCSFYMVDGQAFRVEFLQKEYPDMYSLKGYMQILARELGSRARAASK